MKILLLGEYSSLHWTLAEGLRFLGHDVTVASDGDGFKNYPRDIDLLRKSSSIKDTLHTVGKVIFNLSNFKNYDIVQLINPCFTTLSVGVNRRIYSFLKKHNKKIFLGAFGDDSYWLRACLNNSTFRYSEFFVGGKENHLTDNDRLKQLWLNSDREQLNREIAESCDGIIACLCEYYMAYEKEYKDKLTYIPLPINLKKYHKEDFKTTKDNKISFFIGINKDRSEFKGTDRMYKVLQKLQTQYPNDVNIIKVESVPYEQYVQLMKESHIVLDQLYSYSPAMNGLLAMAQGKILVGGGEPEIYELLDEETNMPIINVIPSEDDIYSKLEKLVLNRNQNQAIADNSRLFVENHHDHITVAKAYLKYWSK